MEKDNFLYRIFDLYYDGFRHMTLGKTLWTIIIIKILIIFVILKMFFFPDFLKQKTHSGGEADYIINALVERSK